MELGAFSISLAVKDMAESREFYSKLGFDMVAGDGESWTILANQSTVIGLFHGMFESNILTFNPGWVGLGEPVADFTYIRELSSRLSARRAPPNRRHQRRDTKRSCQLHDHRPGRQRHPPRPTRLEVRLSPSVGSSGYPFGLRWAWPKLACHT